MFTLLMQSAPERTRILGERGLTPNDSRGLNSLDLDRGRSMRSLAEEWACDASNATWIVDRLEKMGLVERRTMPEDRRVKLVVLTQKGLQVRAELLEALSQPPIEFLDLTHKELEALEGILSRILQRRETVTDRRSVNPTVKVDR